MDHGIYALERLAHRLAVPDVSDPQVDIGIQFRRTDPSGVDLLDQAVQRADLVSLVEEGPGDVLADEAGSAGDQDRFGHAPTARSCIDALPYCCARSNIFFYRWFLPRPRLS